MISERLLRKWRKESLTIIKNDFGAGTGGENRKKFFEYHKRILRLTQELLDQHLLNK